MLGVGIGRKTAGGSPTAIVYGLPLVHLRRTHLESSQVERVDFETRFELEGGVAVTGRRLWTGIGARMRYVTGSDYPVAGRLLVRGGVRF